jgi:RimJ/RimL family protein N-acetyltransferase
MSGEEPVKATAPMPGPAPTPESMRASVLNKWRWSTAARDGALISIRPLQRDDEQREIEFIESLSEQSRHFRMFTPLKYLSRELLSQFMDVDYDRRMALVATVGSGNEEQFIGVVRYGPTDQSDVAELGITVTDAWQRRGVATILIEALERFAVLHGFRNLTGLVLPDNHAMLQLARRLGFAIEYDPAEHLMRISKQLTSDVTVGAQPREP